MRTRRKILFLLLAVVLLGLMATAVHAQTFYPVCIPSPPPETRCGDACDNDRDGRADCRDFDCRLALRCVDADSDNFPAFRDCNDLDPRVNPAAAEACNGIDDDCDGLTDDADSSVLYQRLWYADTDGDTHGDPAVTQTACKRPAGYVALNDDCDDTNTLVHPMAIESCADGVDNECDGSTDCVDADCSADTACVTATSAVTAQYFGMYVGDVKSSDSDNYDGDPDVANTLAALQATGQNLFGYSAHTERELGHFQNILSGAGGAGINVFAVLGERHQESTTSYMQNRWLAEALGYSYLRRSDVATDADANGYTDNFCFDTDGDASESDPATYETCYDQVSPELHDIWLNGLKKAAATFSQLSLTYPELVAFTVDDFDGYPCFADDGEGAYNDWCYTRAEVAEITASAHTHNPDFKFWPTWYFNTIGRILAPGYTLGAKYWNDSDADGVLLSDSDYEVFWTGESAELTLTFTPPATFTSAGLSFFYEDSSMYVSGVNESSLAKKITVNGTDVSTTTGFNTAFDGDAYVEYFNDDIASYLTPGVENTVKITLTTTGDARFGPYYLDVWDIALTIDGADYTAQITSTPSTTEYSLTSTSLVTGGADASLIAESNADYRVTGSDNTIDGVLLTYHALDTFYACSGCDELYAATLKSVKSALGEGDLIVNHYATLYGNADGDGTYEISPATIGADSLMEEIYFDSEIADGIVMYSYPLAASGRNAPKTGIFAKRQNNGNTNTFDVMLYSPWWQPWIMGWYQSWTAPALTGTVYLTLGETAAMGGFVKEVTDGDGNVLYHETASDNECALTAGETCPGYVGGAACTIDSVDCSYSYNLKTTLMLELGTTPTDITVTLNTDEAANIFGMSLYAAFRDATGAAIAGFSGDADADGFIDGYTFSSGIGEANVIKIFDNVSCAYRDIRALDMGGDTLSDTDGDGINDACTVE